MMDNSTTEVSLTLDGVSQTIRHYHGCRGVPELERLTRLENEIGTIVGTAAWTTANPERETAVGVVEQFVGPCEMKECDAEARRLSRNVAVIYREADTKRFESHTVVVCRDGFAHLTDAQLRFVGPHGIQWQVRRDERTALDAFLAKARTADESRVELRYISDTLPALDTSASVEIVLPDPSHFRWLTSDRLQRLPEETLPLFAWLHEHTSQHAWLDRTGELRVLAVPVRPHVARSLWSGQIAPWSSIPGVPGTLLPSEWPSVAKALAFADHHSFHNDVYADGAAFGQSGPMELVVLAGVPSWRRLCEPPAHSLNHG